MVPYVAKTDFVGMLNYLEIVSLNYPDGPNVTNKDKRKARSSESDVAVKWRLE